MHAHAFAFNLLSSFYADNLSKKDFGMELDLLLQSGIIRLSTTSTAAIIINPTTTIHIRIPATTATRTIGLFLDPHCCPTTKGCTPTPLSLCLPLCLCFMQHRLLPSAPALTTKRTSSYWFKPRFALP
jgi:hypothetical protein